MIYSIVPGTNCSHDQTLTGPVYSCTIISTLWGGALHPAAAIIGASEVNNYDAILIYLTGTHFVPSWTDDLYLLVPKAGLEPAMLKLLFSYSTICC